MELKIESIKMERLTVEKNGILYLLHNLSAETVRDLRSDPIRLADHFQRCLDAAENICVVENGTSTSQITSLPIPSQQCQSFDFLCGTVKNRSHIIAIKCCDYPWHYFDEADTISAEHINSLPPTVHVSIGKLKSIKPLTVTLSKEQAQNYVKDGKFIFKKKELKTYMVLDGKEVKGTKSKTSAKTTKQLVFSSGQTNPLLFLNDYEKCYDVRNDKEKMYKIIDFVDESHKGEFTELYFTSNWDSVKSSFLKWYTLPFIQNKKRELKVDFWESSTLRSFFEAKLDGLSRFTTLPFINQIEMILNDLPDVIASLFIVNEKMTLNKAAILAYCDSIEYLVKRPSFNSPRVTDNEPLAADDEINCQPAADNTNSDMEMEMEVFDFVSELPPTSISGRGSGRGRGRGRGRGQLGNSHDGVMRGRVKKRGRRTSDSGESYSFLNEMDSSSRSSWDAN